MAVTPITGTGANDQVTTKSRQPKIQLPPNLDTRQCHWSRAKLQRHAQRQHANARYKVHCTTSSTPKWGATSTCECKRWKTDAPTTKLSQQATVTEQQEQQEQEERSSDKEY